MERLTEKQKLFVDHYLTNGFNATDAARSAGYKGNDVTLGAVGKENLQKPLIRSAINFRTQSVAKKHEKKIINVYEEFTQNLTFTKKMRDAAEVWLADPEDSDKFTLTPRSTEVDIVYYVMGENGPKPVTEPLQTLLARLEENGYDSPTPFVKTVDLRDHALKILDRVDTALDKFAKMGGAYQQDKPNAEASASVVTSYQHWLQDQREGQTIFDAEYTILDDKTIIIHGYEPSDAQKAKWLTRNAEARGVDVSIPAEKAGVDIGTIG